MLWSKNVENHRDWRENVSEQTSWSNRFLGKVFRMESVSASSSELDPGHRKRKQERPRMNRRTIEKT